MSACTAGYSTSNAGTYNMFYQCYNMRNVLIDNLNSSVNLNASYHLSPTSVHYIIEHSNSSRTTESTAITIALNATALANWQASVYYADDLVICAERNITVA